MKDRDCQPESGAALVITVIVVAVLAVVTVAFMQTSSTDRLSSRTVAEHYKAQLAAEAGVAEAVATVTDLVKKYPDSVTVWQNIGAGPPNGTNNEATVLYFRAKQADTNLGALPGDFGNSVTLLARPLISGATNVALASLSNSMSFDPAHMVNLNATNSASPQPSVGLRSMTNPGAPVTAAKWIYLTNSAGQTNARYAFWIEDESFKVNLNVATNGARGSSDLGGWPREGRIDGSLGSSTNGTLAGADFASIARGKPGGYYPTPLTALLAASITNADAAAELRFLATAASAGLDLSRGGFKRFNINTVTNGVASPINTNVICTNLDRVIAAITNTNAAPLFGQRFYRLGTSSVDVNNTNAVTTAHGGIYLQKIAANIYDYLDTDDQPTIINNDTSFSLRTGKPDYGIEPGEGTEGPNPVAAMGIENAPRLQEYALHGRIRKLDPIGYNSNIPTHATEASYRISIDHYFEFWNPGTRDVTLTNAFLKVYDQPRFGDDDNKLTGTLATEGRPFTLPLGNVTFPAGKVTVLTTAPTNEINTALVSAENLPNIISIAGVDDTHRIFEGTTKYTSSGAAFGGNGFDTYFKVSLKPRSTAGNDYESAVLLGNDVGIIDSFVGLPIVRSGSTTTVPAVHFVGSSAAAAAVVGETPAILAQGNQYYAVGGSLAGNSGAVAGQAFAVSGDPRSLNEQLEIKLYDANGGSQQTRFLTAGLNNNGVPGQSTIGAPNNNYVNAANWVDYSSLLSGASSAPLFVRNAPVESIGELGHLTDPARVPGTTGSLTDVIYSRGGGRTLRIGQPELTSWYDGNQTNASRTWTSWRLADIFTTTNAISIPGLINPNGALRDNGAAVRALFHGMTMLPTTAGAPTTAGNPVAVNTLVTNLIARLTNGSPASSGLPAGALNPLWERGELSELPVFSSGSSLAGADMAQTIDRGREEIVRRSIQMITTRGSVFTVHAVGQALRVSSTATNVLSTSRVRTTFEITPNFSDWNAATNDAFNPETATDRFVAPTNYSVKILNSFHD